jgi:hypothetical protein
MNRLAKIVGLGSCSCRARVGGRPVYGRPREVGAFADYFRFTPGSSTTNLVGVGGRLGINVHPNIALEDEMNYDFRRNFTNTFNNGFTTAFVTTSVRPLTGLFGPRIYAGSSGPVCIFVTGKVGFINFDETATGMVSGSTFTNAVNDVGGSGTHVAFYPGGGIEGFIGRVGLRLEVGDEIYLNNGTFNNLRGHLRTPHPLLAVSFKDGGRHGGTVVCPRCHTAAISRAPRTIAALRAQNWLDQTLIRS